MAKYLKRQQARLVSRKAVARAAGGKGGTNGLDSGATTLPGSMNPKKGTGEKAKHRG